MFGGRDEKGPRNTLHIMKINRRPCEWVLANVAGEPPAPRYGHSMHYYPDKNIMIIFGGRNDANYQSTLTSYMNDVWVLALEKLTWVRWDAAEGPGCQPEGRYSHCSEMLGSSVVVFGGLGEDNYCKADVYMLEMEHMRRPRYGGPTLIEDQAEEENKRSQRGGGESSKHPPDGSTTNKDYGGMSPSLFKSQTGRETLVGLSPTGSGSLRPPPLPLGDVPESKMESDQTSKRT